MPQTSRVIAVLVAGLVLAACNSTVYTTVKRGEGKAIVQLVENRYREWDAPIDDPEHPVLDLETLVIAVHPLSGELFFVSPDLNQILKLNAAGEFNAWAGQDAPALAFRSPNEGWKDIVADAQGNLFVSQGQGKVLQLAADGTARVVGQVPDSQKEDGEVVPHHAALSGIGVDTKGDLYVAGQGKDTVWHFKRGAGGTFAPERIPLSAGVVRSPQDVAVGKDGTLYIADVDAGKGQIVKVSPQGTVQVLARVVGTPSRLVVDSADNLYYLASGYVEVHKVTPSGAISVFYKPPLPEKEGDGPVALAIDAEHLELADSQGMLRRISLATSQVDPASPGATVVSSEVANRADFRLHGLAIANGATWVTGEWGTLYQVKGSTVRRVREIGPVPRGGPREQADLLRPGGLAFRPDGTLVIADTEHRVLQAIGPNGVISVLAGNGKQGWVDGAASEASFTLPGPMVIARSGDIYVEDGGVIRRVSPGGQVTSWLRHEGTVKDLALGPDGKFCALLMDSEGFTRVTTFSPSGEEVPVRGAERLTDPRSIAIDSQGRILILDDRFYLNDDRGTTLVMLQPDGREEVIVATRVGDSQGQVLGEYGLLNRSPYQPEPALTPGDLEVGPDGTVYFIHHTGLFGVRNYEAKTGWRPF